jgi:hypothetical protein
MVNILNLGRSDKDIQYIPTEELIEVNSATNGQTEKSSYYEAYREDGDGGSLSSASREDSKSSKSRVDLKPLLAG